MSLRTVVVGQTRTGSARLRGKVPADLDSAPLIAHVLTRAARAARVYEVVLATTERDEDRPLTQVADKLGPRWYLGDEHDVLRRMHHSAREASAEVVVRVRGDCPLISLAVIDRVVDELHASARTCDIAINVLRRTYLKGLDSEAFLVDVLERLDRLGHSAEASEHVTRFAYRERPDLFAIGSMEHAHDRYAGLNWSVDEQRDLDHVRAIYTRYGAAIHDLDWAVLAREGAPAEEILR